MPSPATQHPVSSGVQELIERLRREGVEAGESEARDAVTRARRQADEILSSARREAEELRARTRRDLEAERNAAHEALRLAARDLQLELKERLAARFEAQVKQLVSTELSSHDGLRALILAVAGQVGTELADQAEADQQMQVTIGGDLPDEQLDALTRELAAGLLRDGVELVPAAEGGPAGGTQEGGIRVRLAGQDIEVDLSANALANLLLRRLTPRFRELFAALTA